MAIRLPDRYEDLDPSYRSHLRPLPKLLDGVRKASKSIQISGGIRFLPVLGVSGAGKTSAVSELSTHFPGCEVIQLEREDVESRESFLRRVGDRRPQFDTSPPDIRVAIVDQYEEQVAAREGLPSKFVEMLSLVDRSNDISVPLLVIWLTTDAEFQSQLAAATSRNKRILLSEEFSIEGPERAAWPSIIRDMFSFHNGGALLANYGVLDADIESLAQTEESIGDAIAGVVEKLDSGFAELADISNQRVVMLWPVASQGRLLVVQSYASPEQQYKLNWDYFVAQIPDSDRDGLPLASYNKARLYFDFRIVPVWVADLHMVCKSVDKTPSKSLLDRFGKTHYVRVVKGDWGGLGYKAMLEWKASSRAREGAESYGKHGLRPIDIHKRLAEVLSASGVASGHEVPLTSGSAPITPDISSMDGRVLTEAKLFSEATTTRAAVRDQIRSTLAKYAQYGGFLGRT